MIKNRFQVFLQNFRITYRRFWRLVWPVQWSLFLRPKDLLKAIRFSSYPLRVGLSLSLLVGVISLFFVYNSLYTLSVYRVPARTGYIEEGLLGLNRSDIANFNPLLTPNSDYERRIVSLIFHPLYRVMMPNFNSGDQNIRIEPVLLAQAPRWTDEQEPDTNNRFRRLRMVLRDDLKWSDGSLITLDDVKATFEKLKTKEANSDFSSSFVDINFEVIDGQKNTFDLVADRPSPQLLYSANFSPVSRDQFFNQSISQIAESAVKLPQLTSGFYTFALSPSGVVQDPRDPTQEKKPNPFIDTRTGVIQSIILQRSNFQNLPEQEPFVEYYIFQRYPKFKLDISTDPQLSTLSSGSLDSLQEAFNKQKSSLYFRSTINSIDVGLSSEQVKEVLTTNQKVVPSNSYYSLFLRARSGTFLINKSLRKYILCNISKADVYNGLDLATKENLIPIEQGKSFLPIQLQTTKDLGCGQNLGDILNNMDKKTYTLVEPEVGSSKRKVFLNKTQISLILVASERDRQVARKIQESLSNAGFIVDILDQDQLSTQPENSALIYLLPITVATPDVYNLFSRKAKNLVGASNNNDLASLEDELLAYRSDNFSPSAKAKLADYLLDSSLTMTIAQGKEEYNYSPKVFGFAENLPNFTTMAYEIYYYLPTWYVNRETKSNIFG